MELPDVVFRSFVHPVVGRTLICAMDVEAGGSELILESGIDVVEGQSVGAQVNPS